MSKKLIMVRGPQGAGKSTFVRLAGLEGFAISLDAIRDVIAGDNLSPFGFMGPNHEYEHLAGRIFEESCDRRIANGEVVVMDGTMADGNMVYRMWSKFEAAGYDALLVDLYGFDDDLRQARNAARPERLRIPQSSVDRMRTIAEKAPLPPLMLNSDRLMILNPTNDAEVLGAAESVPDFLQDPRTRRDLSGYDRVVHVGDIQGCFSPIADPASPLRDGLRDDTFYVFLGDLFDRGKENGEVALWFVRNALGRDNVALISGNHEDYVDRQALAKNDDIDAPNSDWVRFSWPQIKAAGIDWREIRKVSKFAQDYLAYTWRGKEVLCSHAGFARWPTNLDLVSRHQMRRGSGHYSATVDAQWSEAEAGTGRFQIHGHRNDKMFPTLASPLSFNLEGQVEFGGHMRTVTLDDDGFRAVDVRSKVYRTMQEEVAVNKEVERESSSRLPPILPWALVGAKAGKLSRETMRILSDHDMISVRESGGLYEIVSINFTKQAFHSARWDEYTTVARGLFVDRTDGTIVARSYPKFFNHNERPETESENLARNVKFPITAYEKRNGFLCITGYSDRLGREIIASKSRTDGDFADMARSVLLAEIGEAGMERMARLNRDQLCSLVFEIEEPEKDPHIISLDRPRAVLLGCVRRSENFEQASYKDLKRIAEWVGCDVKRSLGNIPNPAALASFNRRVEHDPRWGVAGERSEGVVMEDASGFAYKLKSHYYRNWKFMRSAIDEIRRARTSDRAPRLGRFDGVEPEFKAFLDWAQTLASAALDKGVIALRDSYEGGRSVMEAIRDPEPEVTPADVKAARFSALIDRILDEGRITRESLTRFVSSACEDPEKAEVIGNHARLTEVLEQVSEEESPEP